MVISFKWLKPKFINNETAIMAACLLNGCLQNLYTLWPPTTKTHFLLLSFLFLFICHVVSTSSFYSSNFFFYSFFLGLIGLKSQWAHIIMNKKLSVCKNIPERAQTNHHHPPPLDGGTSSPISSGPMDLSQSHKTEIWKFWKVWCIERNEN